METQTPMQDSSLTKEDGRLVRGEATRERVLDAAERLFADQGFDGVSIRQIANEAGVTLGVVGFHGGSKAELFATILRRRSAALSQARRVALATATGAGSGTLALHDVMQAYIRPYIELASSGDPQWEAYARLIAHMVSDERWYPSVKDLYDPVAREFLAVIAGQWPQADPGRLAAAFVMSVAAMLSIVASTLRISVLAGSGQADAKPSPFQLCDVLVDFCTGGIERAALGVSGSPGRAKGGPAGNGRSV